MGIGRRSFAVMLVAICCVSSSLLLAQSDPAVDEAVDRLMTVDLFALGGVGYVGVPTPGERDYRFLLKRPVPEAINAFEKLFSRGNAQGKSYAMAGLTQLDPERFQLRPFTLAYPQMPVSVAEGCIYSTKTLREVADDLRQAQFSKGKRTTKSPEGK